MSPDKALEVGIELAKSAIDGPCPYEVSRMDSRYAATTLAALRMGLPMLIALCDLVDKTERGCDCEYDHRCGRCQRIIDAKEQATKALAALAPEGGQT